MGGLSIAHVIVLLLVVVGGVVPYALIFRKAGYTGWLALLMLIPIVNYVLTWWFALADWPSGKADGGAFR